MTPPWYVLTGGPSAGKTTLLEALSRRGYRTISEAARDVIERRLSEGESLEDIRRDERAFQMEVLDLKLERERALSKSELWFLDRGLPDTVAYLRAKDIPLDAQTITRCGAAHYAAVFQLEMLPYVKDEVRIETPEEARRIDQELERAYQSIGVAVVRVPVMPVEERVDFILRHVSL